MGKEKHRTTTSGFPRENANTVSQEQHDQLEDAMKFGALQATKVYNEQLKELRQLNEKLARDNSFLRAENEELSNDIQDSVHENEDLKRENEDILAALIEARLENERIRSEKDELQRKLRQEQLLAARLCADESNNSRGFGRTSFRASLRRSISTIVPDGREEVPVAAKDFQRRGSTRN